MPATVPEARRCSTGPSQVQVGGQKNPRRSGEHDKESESSIELEGFEADVVGKFTVGRASIP